MKTQDIEYHAGGERFVGYLAVEDGKAGLRPGVLLAPEGPGLGDLAKGFARRLAQRGYVAFAMDYHGDGQVLSDMGEVMSRLGGFMSDPSGIRTIAAEALRVLSEQPETDKARLAAIGYCFGGTTALELARSGAPLKAAVGFHAGLATTKPAEKGGLKAVILAQIGADDPVIPPEQRAAFEAEMTKAGADWRMILYGGAGHSFTNPDVGAMGRIGFAYNEAADKRSWRAMLDLFDEVFGPV
ncbi:MAG TPA: dienelactone hydrolase family protein [Caulobacteraceae bacterium]|jgi:dienelactone hydrolase|nr:dienelactone hydrolase family protein [Caulobacteraceae bacterium]